MRLNLFHRSTAFLLASTALAAPAAAQLASMPAMPRSRVLDANNVDLATGKFISPSTELSIGTKNSGMVFSEKLVDGLWWVSNYHIALATTGSNATLTIGTEAKKFTGSGPTYTTDDGDGSTLSYNSGTQKYSYTARDGTVIVIPNASRRAESITYPNGAKFTLYYDTTTAASTTYYRLRSVGSSNGHQVRLTYSLANMSNNANNYRVWAAPSTAMIFSNAAETCQPSATSCSFASSWPTMSFSGILGLTVTSPSGDTRYTSAEYPASSGNYRVTGIKRASSSTDNTTISYDGNNRVYQVATDGRTWTYGYSLSGLQMTTSVTDPDSSQARVIVSDVNLGVMYSTKNSLNKITSYTYDGYGRLTRVTQPEGNYTELTYDTSSPTRGNVVQTKQAAKPTLSAPDIISSATYPSSCAYAVNCNKPTSTTDARGNTTDYTYDITHGGVLTVTRPAPTGGAVRPQTRYGYNTSQAYFMNGSGSVIASGVPTYELTSTSECQTTSSCASAADEVKTTIGYGPQTAGTANNLYPINVTKGSGDNALTATTAFTYDDRGNVTYVDGPLSGTVDKTRFSYDDSRRLWGLIGPDPDGTGMANPLQGRAYRKTFLADMAIKTEYGTTTKQLDGGPTPAWDTFVPSYEVDTYFDVSGRKVKDVLAGSNGTVGIVQYSYDNKGRLECAAQRMNTGAFDSLPSSGCTVGPNGFQGSDRITKLIYDDADQVLEVQTAVGVSGVTASERTISYSSNGKVQTIKDAENNLTTYEYDGQDRLLIIRLPNTTKGSNSSSSTDYEQLTYETTVGGTRTSDTVSSFRNRSNETIAFTFNNLGRLTFKDLQGVEPDVSYGYDNLGRLTSASQSGNSFAFTYDALDRNLTQVSPQGTVTSVFDLAGRRTQLTYPGSGLYVNYDYLNTGDVTKIRENGATSGVGVLATYTYDNLGNRTSVTFGNGVVQSFTYDPVSRLATLTNDLSGTTNDLTVNPISYDSASGIQSTTRAGDSYAWTGPSSQSLSYTSNGLNQYTAVSGLTPTYDSRGNLTSDGVNSFGYSSENLLLTGPNSSTLSYDPMMRLQQIATPSDTVRFGYDGVNRIADTNSTNSVRRRFVYGPGMDEPVVQYEGADTSARRFLSSDERGSIISVTSSTGSLFGINKYDEFGIPQLDGGGNNVNTGRFQYTGQAWLPEIGVYYYKSRMYSPTLGRFLQPDPIGIDDGLNLYAYVGHDPVNWTDPSGNFGVPGAVIGGTIGGLAGGYGYISGHMGSDNGAGASAGGFLTAVFTGAAGGAIAGGTGTYLGAAAGAIIGVGGNYISGRFDKAENEKEDEKKKAPSKKGP